MKAYFPNSASIPIASQAKETGNPNSFTLAVLGYSSGYLRIFTEVI